MWCRERQTAGILELAPWDLPPTRMRHIMQVMQQLDMPIERAYVRRVREGGVVVGAWRMGGTGP